MQENGIVADGGRNCVWNAGRVRFRLRERGGFTNPGSGWNRPGGERQSGYGGGGSDVHLFGPGLLSTVGENGSIDLISGLEMPGYQVIVDRWNELHPNVKLVIEAQPWDNWQAAIQTAVLSGDVDIIMHGASLADLDEPLDPYLEKEPELLEQIYTVAQRRTDATGDMSVMTSTGMCLGHEPHDVYSGQADI